MKDRPDRIFVDKEYLKDFKLLQEEKDSPLYKKDNKDVFIMAMVMGVKNGVRIPLKIKKEYILRQNLVLKVNQKEYPQLKLWISKKA
jgi:hypothetical protein